MFKRFNEFVDDDFLTDRHMHSVYSDGEGRIEDLIAQAKRIGLKQIAVTDHIRKDSVYFPDFQAEIGRLRDEKNFDVLVGFEAKIEDFQGHIDVADDVNRKADVRIASVHRFPIGRRLIPAASFSPEVSQEIELELSVAACRRKMMNVLGHPGGMSLRNHGVFRIDFFEEIITACLENDIAFDLNGSYHQPVMADLLPLLRKHNVRVSLGSDAHRIEQMANFTEALSLCLK